MSQWRKSEKWSWYDRKGGLKQFWILRINRYINVFDSTRLTKHNLTSTNCPPAPKLPERTCVLLDDSLVSDRAHSHCQLADADLSRSSFMTTAEPRSQSARLAGSCLSYQAVVRVVHPAAPGCTLPPSICSPLLGSGPPLYQLTTYWTAATLFLSLCVWELTQFMNFALKLKCYIPTLFSHLDWFLFNFEYLNSIFCYVWWNCRRSTLKPRGGEHRRVTARKKKVCMNIQNSWTFFLFVVLKTSPFVNNLLYNRWRRRRGRQPGRGRRRRQQLQR